VRNEPKLHLVFALALAAVACDDEGASNDGPADAAGPGLADMAAPDAGPARDATPLLDGAAGRDAL
jgi:hypothetical protein